MTPVYLFILPLAVAFFMPLIDRIGRIPAMVLTAMAATAMTVVAFYNSYLVFFGGTSLQIITSGLKPPFAINLLFGHQEALIVSLLCFIGSISFYYLLDNFQENHIGMLIAYLMVIMGVVGLVMTRDLFNIFVFLEITAISLYAIIASQKKDAAIQAGFRFMIAGGIASMFYLIGTIFFYRFSGQLNIDFALSLRSVAEAPLLTLGLFFLVTTILIELKPFPANGWAIDLYGASNSGINSIISSLHGTAVIFVFYKLLPLIPHGMLNVITGAGFVTWFFGNMIGIKEKNPMRMFGLSSVSTLGLVMATLALGTIWKQDNLYLLLVPSLLIVNHVLAKAGLFWFLSTDESPEVKGKDGTAMIPKSKLALFGAGLLAAALVGLPPFPGFWAKWALIKELAFHSNYIWLVALLIGTLFEAWYMVRWFSAEVKKAVDYDNNTAVEKNETELPWPRPVIDWSSIALFPLWLILGATGTIIGHIYFKVPLEFFIPLAAFLVLAFLDWLPLKLKGFLALVLTGGTTWFALERTEGISWFFTLLLGSGAVLHTVASVYTKKNRYSFHSGFLLSALSLIGLPLATKGIEFLLLWETMAMGSFLIILKGRNGEQPSIRFLLFSLLGTFLLMSGFTPSLDQTTAGTILQALGFLIKIGVLGFHVWVPAAYGEAEDDFSSFLSSVTSKVSIFALMVFVIPFVKDSWVSNAIGWLGIITAFSATLSAIYQEDIKKLLAWSSIGQLGYIVLALSMQDHFGFTTALYLTVNHFIFKAMLFLAVAGVIYRTKTRKMYQMGGLIKKMPLSFISVLMAIIAVSGVPPLSGFGSKWLLYTGLLERGMYAQAIVAFFTSTIAFLYLFRLIHTMFLGQPKLELRDIKEAPVWLITPQIILMMALMAMSSFPKLLLEPLAAFAAEIFPGVTLTWNGSTLTSGLGYWNGSYVMYVTMGVFALPLIWLLIVMRRPQPIKQFNIVFAAERPERPETTHYAYNFFAPYKKALWFLSKPVFFSLWKGIRETLYSFAKAFGQFYSGNGQTYALQIVLYVGVLYIILGGR